MSKGIDKLVALTILIAGPCVLTRAIGLAEGIAKAKAGHEGKGVEQCPARVRAGEWHGDKRCNYICAETAKTSAPGCGGQMSLRYPCLMAGKVKADPDFPNIVQ